MYQNDFQNGKNNSSSKTRSVFNCLQAPDFMWDLNDSTFSLTLVALILIASPVTILLNAMVIIAVRQKKELQKRSNVMLSSMAVADLLVGTICMPLFAVVDLLIVRQVLLEHVCTLNSVNIDLLHCFLWSSLYHITVIAWERYVAICKWMDYRIIVTRGRLKKLAIIAWLLAIFTNVPVLIMKSVVVDFEVTRNWMTFVNVCGAVALMLIIYFYVVMYLSVRKRKKSTILQVSAVVQAKLESKVAKTTGLLTVALILTFVLGVVLLGLAAKFPTLSVKSFRISETFLQLHSLINPLLYCYRDHRIRNAILELLKIRKPQAIQPEVQGAVRFRRRKDCLGSVENVQQKEENGTRLTRSASYDSAGGFANHTSFHPNSNKMKLRSNSAPSLVKNLNVRADLQPQQPSSIMITTATIHNERTARYKTRKSFSESPNESVNTSKGKKNRNTARSTSLDNKSANVRLSKRSKEKISRRAKTAPSLLANAILPYDGITKDDVYTSER